MTKDYVTIGEEVIDVLGHKVKVVTERFSDEYLSSKRFQPRCLRCIFNPGHLSYEAPCLCRYLHCGQHFDTAIHFESDEQLINRVNKLADKIQGMI